MKLATAIDRFLEHVRVEKGLAERSVRAYESDLLHWRVFLEEGRGEPARIECLEPLDLKDYVAHLRDDRGLKPRSISRVMSTLRVFFEHFERTGVISKNPARGLHNPKIPRKLPVYLVGDEVRRLLQVPDQADKSGIRDHAILLTFLMTGMRLSELVGLDRRAFDFGAGAIRVLGKGSKERLIPLHPAVAAALARHMDGMGHSPTRDEPVFQDAKGRRMTARMVGWVVRTCVQRAGLPVRVTPHKLRHTFATQLLHKGASLLEIKELLGHSHISTTSIYTHTNVERLRTAVEKIAQ
ncbi:tyrosine recombinase XerC [Candidatus Poribacteria bacterium]|nr:tyrosine recombinase XerC [Candidatus Poribacteria bacterium]